MFVCWGGGGVGGWYGCLHVGLGVGAYMYSRI